MPFLSEDQREGIVNRLRKNKKYALPVTFPGEDVSIASFALDLASALREGGWEVSGPSPADCGVLPEVLIAVDDFSSPHPSARLLLDVLTAVGIGVRLVPASDTGPSRCCLRVRDPVWDQSEKLHNDD